MLLGRLVCQADSWGQFAFIVMIILCLPANPVLSDSVMGVPLCAHDNLSEPLEVGYAVIPTVQYASDGGWYSVRGESAEQSANVIAAAASGKSLSLVFSVASIWTRGEQFRVDVYVYLIGYLYADLTIQFEGFDNCPGPGETQEVYKSQSVTASGSCSIHTLWCYLPSWATVGLKRAEIHVVGKAYYKEGIPGPESTGSSGAASASGFKFDYVSRTQTWGYEFVARYGIADLQTYGGLPPSDLMSYLSGNPTYYWEGLASGGFSIPLTRAVFRPAERPIVFESGFLVDNCVSYPEYTAEVLTSQVNSLMEYYSCSDTLQTTNADMFTYNYNWRGVCDEIAIVLCSFLRVMNIPCRYMVGYDAPSILYPDGFCHAWCETYVSGYWHHCDATMDLFDMPWYYKINLVALDWVNISSCGDDGIGNWGSYDGDAYNGKLHCYEDWGYWAQSYDGPNDYF